MRPLLLLSLAAAAHAAPDSRIVLRDNWTLTSSAGGPTYRIAAPSTVFSALVAHGVYPDPYFGMNLRSAPGVSYAIGTMFANQAMPPGSPFHCAWRYRTEFRLPADFAGKTVRLGFDGINFRANLTLNGKPIAAKEQFAGAWRLFEFDVTAAVKPGAANELVVDVFPPEPGDLAITFVDWNPMPPDKMMGIWRDVWIAA
ncbi:MAG: glycosyl hydrolase family 2, partial [Acidobacteriota bacterium]|nr:glycosyl hydrolase family 2 [Acidobacteriota bacterium]